MAASHFERISRVMDRVSDVSSEPERMLTPIQGYENERITTLEKAVKPLVPYVPDVEKMLIKVQQKCQQPKDNLTLDELGAIMLYTYESEFESELTGPTFYSILNATLRTENRQKLKPWFLYLRLFIYALAKLPDATHRIIYRGMCKDSAQNFQNEQIVTWWGFSSCTSSLEVIQQFLSSGPPKTIFNIEGNSCKDIARYSYYPKESEILFYPARQFIVMSSLQPAARTKIIHLKEIQPRFPLIHIPKVISTVTNSTTATSTNQQLKNKIKEFECRSKVDLSSQNITDDDIEMIVKEVIINKQCTWLYLEKNNITSVGISMITKALNNNNTLEWLDISYNRLADEGVHHLTDVLAMNSSKLKALHLWSTGITDEGAEYLAEMLKINRRLTHLGLAENKIGEVGVQYLTEVLTHHNNTLTVLDLSLNKSVKDTSVDMFVQMLKRNRSLTELNLEKCSLTSTGKDKLQQIAKSKNNFNLIL